ncbi:hypothetical protein ASC66_09420 [Leifsonia sp. Root4]|uniref:glycosyltransferase family 2 protein n=1 Tax=Leifsonia sp. Root4 TaxID=1736525 RepID=UPI000700ED83|nr:glycosyltransferase family A protein [Leifsonia sp. Root4]KQW06664.1 hypothetical protein ASC66_09420 [Leifsonia sp. Root4]
MSHEELSVSVVIPTHNRTDLLERAVRSVLSQSMTASELVVVDDVGAESVRALVEGLARDAPFAVRYIDASGAPVKAAGTSRNIGALATSGEILAFLDDDDFWHESYLQRSTQVMTSGSFDLVITCGYFQTDDRLELAKTPSVEDLSGTDAGMTGSNMIVRRTAFEAVDGFDPNMWVLNDRDLFMRLQQSGIAIGICEDRLVTQDGRGAGHLSSRGERRAIGLERFLTKHSARLGRPEKRHMKRSIHRARTGPEHSIGVRVLHIIALCFYTKPSGYATTIKRRVLLRRASY